MSDKKISQLTGATTPLAGTEVLPVVQSGQTKKVSVDDLTAGKLVNTGQLTVGSAASPWSFVGSALDVAGNGSIFGGPTLSTVGLFIGSNVYWNGGYKYKVSGQVATEYVQVAGQHIWSTAPFGTANDPITFTQVMNIDASGNVTANIGNIKPGTAGKGIDFSANTGAPGMTSELLDWYEEGLFTPAFTSTGASIALAFSRGIYTRVGRLVTASVYIQVASVSGTTSNPLTITGLPFASVSGTEYGFSAAIGVHQFSGLTPSMFMAQGATSINIYELGTVNNVTAASLAAGYYLATITYMTD
jgi:hypothetical protein